MTTIIPEPQPQAIQHLNRSAQLQQLLTLWRKRLDPNTISWLTQSRAHRRAGAPRHISQEQFAILCGLTPSYYGALERGQERHYSEETLDAIAEVAQLSNSERTVLYRLAIGREPKPHQPAPPPHLTAAMEALIQAQPWPAYIFDGCWNLMARNEATRTWFPHWDEQPNLMLALFQAPESRTQLVDWDTVHVPRAIAQMKAQLSQFPECADLKTLIREILRTSALARRLWNDDATVKLHDDGHRYTLNVPDCCAVTVEVTTAAPSRHAELRMTTLVPADGQIPAGCPQRPAAAAT